MVTITDPELREFLDENPEYEELFSDWGWDLGMMLDVSSAMDMIEILLDNELVEQADRFLNELNKAQDFYTQAVLQLTGRDITYDDRVDRWRDRDTGRFVKNPYTDVRTTQEDFERSIIEKYGY